MIDPEAYYCKIFIDTNVERADLVGMLAERCDGQVKARTIVTVFGEMDVRRNEDYVPRSEYGGTTDFVRFPYYVDVIPNERIDRSSYVGAIASLLDSAQRAGLVAVASCDFEEELTTTIAR